LRSAARPAAIELTLLLAAEEDLPLYPATLPRSAARPAAIDELRLLLLLRVLPVDATMVISPVNFVDCASGTVEGAPARKDRCSATSGNILDE
jgi:hypothetical protein